MKRELDCRGQACPAPVMQVRDILVGERPASIAIMVDNEAARENVSRFLAHQGYQVTVEEEKGGFKVIGFEGGEGCRVMDDEELAAVPVGGKKILVMLTTDRLGHGDEALGAGLMLNFLKTLKEMGPVLWRLVMVNSGVKLAVEGAEALPVLRELADAGVSILVCGTCLNHFKLLDRKQVGETTNMLDIVTSLQVADSVINI
ncbi:MAG: sulfurtransferase-like selenium metabolism protein YedF [Proteobacteria bacterium]|nr:sulfurtransferase-like selenium metabolism protein YedF [Pseudomonadota bacterium]MBU1738326.1 sulfurtransferase-like selenium metabolism protein YedF [Pseudomonadota bacterium]